jgi:class 3 adenylate cyclase
MASLISEFRGRVVDSPGDNILAEFANVVDAVEAAVEIQNKLNFFSTVVKTISNAGPMISMG